MPNLQAQATALRADGHKLRAYVTFFKGQEVAEFEADTAYVDADYPLTSISGSYNSGSEADVGEGFLVEIRRAAGGLRTVTRTRYGATQTSTALHIRELSRAESVTGITDLLIVRREVRLSDKLVEATEDFDPDGIPVGTFNLNPPPIANSGGLDVGFVDSGQTFRTVQFFGDLSFAVDPASGGTLNHTWTIPSGGGAFQSGSTSTDENPVMEINVGHWLIQHDVEDDGNGAITTQYIMVVVHDHSAAAPYECLIEPMEGGKEDGWGYRVQVFENADADDIPYGSYAFVWVDESINGSTQSFGSPVTGRSHIKAVGIIRREETREDGTNDSLSFEMISPLARLGELAGFSKVMLRTASPVAWSEINTLKTRRAMLQIIIFYCNFNNAGFDVIIDADVPDYDYPTIFFQKDSPLGQIRELASGTQCRFICDRRGSFQFIPILNVMTRTARNNRTTSYVFSRDDIIDIQVSQEHWRPIETFRLKGFTANATTPNPIFAKYPGDAPGQGNQSGAIERIICHNIAQAYFLCGQYGAMEDGWYTNPNGVGYFAPRVTITVPGSYDVLDFYGEWIEFDFSLRLRGLDLSAFRYELVRSTVTYDGGTAQCVFELQAETFGEPGVDDTPPASDTSGLTDWTDIWGTISFTPLPDSLLGLGQNRIGIVWSDGSITLTDEWGETASPTWWVEHDYNTTILSAVQDINTPSTLHIAFAATIRRLTGVGSGSPSSTTELTFASNPAGVTRIINIGRNAPLNVVCLSYDDSFGTNYAFSSDGGDSYSEGNISANAGDAGRVNRPGLYIRENGSWLVRTAVYDGGTSTTGYVSTNGTSWSSAANPNLTTLRRLGGIYAAYLLPDVLYANRASSIAFANFSLLRVDGTTQTDISPTHSATPYGLQASDSNRVMAIADNNKDKAVLIGRSDTNTPGSVGLWKTSSLSSMATGAGWSLVVTPGSGGNDNFLLVEIGGDGRAVYAAGIRKAWFGEFDTLDTSLTDVSGNLSSILPAGAAAIRLFGW